MSNLPLFGCDVGEHGGGPKPKTRKAEARVVGPVRNQVEMTWGDLDSCLPEDHEARGVWAFVEKLDLEKFYGCIKAVSGEPGRPTTDPKVLLALWLYANAKGIGPDASGHDAFRWLRGGVPINPDMSGLADFRTEHGEALNDLLTQLLAAMMVANVVKLKRVSQDGIRVRASAGASSFRREGKLKALVAEARQQVETLAAEVEHPGETSRREQAARERAMRERVERVTKALGQLPVVRAVKKTAADREEARVSTTDPEARVMKMGDGGYRPAFNVQLATDTESQVIVGVSVTNQGSDAGQATPMLEQVTQRCKAGPEEYLVDGGFATLNEVEKLTQAQVTVYAPIQTPRGTQRERTEPRRYDTPGVAQWRARMGTAEAKAIYKQRAATSECVNAQCRRRYGLHQFTVRGLTKVATAVLLTVIAHNMLRWIALGG